MRNLPEKLWNAVMERRFFRSDLSSPKTSSSGRPCYLWEDSIFIFKSYESMCVLRASPMDPFHFQSQVTRQPRLDPRFSFTFLFFPIAQLSRRIWVAVRLSVSVARGGPTFQLCCSMCTCKTLPASLPCCSAQHSNNFRSCLFLFSGRFFYSVSYSLKWLLSFS